MRKKIQYIVTIPGGECWIKAYSASEAIKEAKKDFKLNNEGLDLRGRGGKFKAKIYIDTFPKAEKKKDQHLSWEDRFKD